jgi:hypothetical protein
MRRIPIFASFLLFFILVILPLSPGCSKVAGSVPVERWIQTYQGAGEDTGNCVKQTADNGYIILGRTAARDEEKSSIYLLKTNSKGLTRWTQTFSSPDEMSGQSLLTTADGGYLITGYTHTFVSTGEFYPLWKGNSSVFLQKVNSNGEELWNRKYQYNDQEVNYGWTVQPAVDGGYVIVGATGHGPTAEGLPGQTDVFLIKTDQDGQEKWNHIYGGEREDNGYDIKPTADRGYIIVGRTYSLKKITSYFIEYSAVYLIKTDVNGQEEWSRTFGDDQTSGYSIQQTRDGGYILVGFTGSFGDESDVLLIKTDESGQELWTRTFSIEGNNQGFCLEQTKDDGYIITGYTGSVSPFGGSKVYLIKTDVNGRELWHRVFSGKGFSCGNYVQQTTDGGYIVVGHTSRSADPINNSDILVIKVDGDGGN